MVPSSYHAFFSGSVSAAGALIGLLFVAISIAPHKLAGEQASTGFQIKAGLVLALRDPELRARRAAIGVRFVGLLSIFTVQLIESLALGSRPHDTAPLSVDCTLVVVCFLVAIDRAWELLGASDTNVLKMLGRELRRRRQEPGAPADGPAPDAAEPE